MAGSSINTSRIRGNLFLAPDDSSCMPGAGLAIDGAGRPVLALPLQGSVWRATDGRWEALWHGGGIAAGAGAVLACPCAPVWTPQGVVVLDARSRELVWLRARREEV